MDSRHRGKNKKPVALETVVPRDGSRDDLKILPGDADGLRPDIANICEHDMF